MVGPVRVPGGSAALRLVAVLALSVGLALASGCGVIATIAVATVAIAGDSGGGTTNAPATALLASVPRSFNAESVTVTYAISDPEGDLADLQVEFAVPTSTSTPDDALVFSPAVLLATTSGTLDAVEAGRIIGVSAPTDGAAHTFTWDAVASGVTRTTTFGVRLRVKSGGGTSTSFPFTLGNDAPSIQQLVIDRTSGVIPITFQLVDPSADAASVRVLYAPTPGAAFEPATVLGQTVDLATGSTLGEAPVIQIFWDTPNQPSHTAVDLRSFRSDGVRVRVEVRDGGISLAETGGAGLLTGLVVANNRLPRGTAVAKNGGRSPSGQGIEVEIAASADTAGQSVTPPERPVAVQLKFVSGTAIPLENFTLSAESIADGMSIAAEPVDSKPGIVNLFRGTGSPVAPLPVASVTWNAAAQLGLAGEFDLRVLPLVALVYDCKFDANGEFQPFGVLAQTIAIDPSITIGNTRPVVTTITGVPFVTTDGSNSVRGLTIISFKVTDTDPVNLQFFVNTGTADIELRQDQGDIIGAIKLPSGSIDAQVVWDSTKLFTSEPAAVFKVVATDDPGFGTVGLASETLTSAPFQVSNREAPNVVAQVPTVRQNSPSLVRVPYRVSAPSPIAVNVTVEAKLDSELDSAFRAVAITAATGAAGFSGSTILGLPGTPTLTTYEFEFNAAADLGAPGSVTGVAVRLRIADAVGPGNFDTSDIFLVGNDAPVVTTVTSLGGTGPVPFDFTIRDPRTLDAVSVTSTFSLDGTVPAATAATFGTTVGLATSETGTAQSLVWNSGDASQLGRRHTRAARLGVRATDAAAGIQTSSAPFEVDNDSPPIAFATPLEARAPEKVVQFDVQVLDPDVAAGFPDQLVDLQLEVQRSGDPTPVPLSGTITSTVGAVTAGGRIEGVNVSTGGASLRVAWDASSQVTASSDVIAVRARPFNRIIVGTGPALTFASAAEGTAGVFSGLGVGNDPPQVASVTFAASVTFTGSVDFQVFLRDPNGDRVSVSVTALIPTQSGTQEVLLLSTRDLGSASLSDLATTTGTAGLSTPFSWNTLVPETVGSRDISGIRLRVDARDPFGLTSTALSGTFRVNNNDQPAISVNSVTQRIRKTSEVIAVGFTVSDSKDPSTFVKVEWAPVIGGVPQAFTPASVAAITPSAGQGFDGGAGELTGVTTTTTGFQSSFTWSPWVDAAKVSPTPVSRFALRLSVRDAFTAGGQAGTGTFVVGNDLPEIRNLRLTGDSGNVVIIYDVADSTNDPADVVFSFAIDRATPSATAFILGTRTQLSTSVTGSPHDVVWDTQSVNPDPQGADLRFVYSEDVRLFVRALDSIDQLAGPVATTQTAVRNNAKPNIVAASVEGATTGTRPADGRVLATFRVFDDGSPARADLALDDLRFRVQRGSASFVPAQSFTVTVSATPAPTTGSEALGVTLASPSTDIFVTWNAGAQFGATGSTTVAIQLEAGNRLISGATGQVVTLGAALLSDPVFTAPIGIGNTAPQVVTFEPTVAIASGILPLNLRLRDLDGDAVDVTITALIPSRGPIVLTASALGNLNTSGLPAPSGGQSYVVNWDTAQAATLLDDEVSGVTLRIDVRDPFGGTATAVTAPFRVDNNPDPAIVLQTVGRKKTPSAADRVAVSYTLIDGNDAAVDVEVRWAPADLVTGVTTAPFVLAKAVTTTGGADGTFNGTTIVGVSSSAAGTPHVFRWDPTSALDAGAVATSVSRFALQLTARDAAGVTVAAVTNSFVVGNTPPQVIATARSGTSGNIQLSAVVADLSGDAANVVYQFARDRAKSVTQASILGSTTSQTTSPSGVTNTVVWDTAADLSQVFTRDARIEVFALDPDDNIRGATVTITGVVVQNNAAPDVSAESIAGAVNGVRPADGNIRAVFRVVDDGDPADALLRLDDLRLAFVRGGVTTPLQDGTYGVVVTPTAGAGAIAPAGSGGTVSGVTLSAGTTSIIVTWSARPQNPDTVSVSADVRLVLAVGNRLIDVDGVTKSLATPLSATASTGLIGIGNTAPQIVNFAPSVLTATGTLPLNVRLRDADGDAVDVTVTALIPSPGPGTVTLTSADLGGIALTGVPAPENGQSSVVNWDTARASTLLNKEVSGVTLRLDIRDAFGGTATTTTAGFRVDNNPDPAIVLQTVGRLKSPSASNRVKATYTLIDGNDGVVSVDVRWATANAAGAITSTFTAAFAITQTAAAPITLVTGTSFARLEGVPASAGGVEHTLEWNPLLDAGAVPTNVSRFALRLEARDAAGVTVAAVTNAFIVGNTAPSLTLTQAAITGSANIQVAFTLADATSDSADVLVSFAVTPGATPADATILGTRTRLETSAGGGTGHTFVWDSGTDLPRFFSRGARLTLTPRDPDDFAVVGAPITLQVDVENNDRPLLTFESAAPTSDRRGLVAAFRVFDDLAPTATAALRLDDLLFEVSTNGGVDWVGIAPPFSASLGAETVIGAAGGVAAGLDLEPLKANVNLADDIVLSWLDARAQFPQITASALPLSVRARVANRLIDDAGAVVTRAFAETKRVSDPVVITGLRLGNDPPAIETFAPTTVTARGILPLTLRVNDPDSDILAATITATIPGTGTVTLLAADLGAFDLAQIPAPSGGQTYTVNWDTTRVGTVGLRDISGITLQVSVRDALGLTVATATAAIRVDNNGEPVLFAQDVLRVVNAATPATVRYRVLDSEDPTVTVTARVHTLSPSLAIQATTAIAGVATTGGPQGTFDGTAIRNVSRNDVNDSAEFRTFTWDARTLMGASPTTVSRFAIEITVTDPSNQQSTVTTTAFIIGNDAPNVLTVTALTDVDGKASGKVAFQFTLADSTSDTADVTVLFQFHGNDTPRPATIVGTVTNLETSIGGTPHTLVWDTDIDVRQLHLLGARLLVQAEDSAKGATRTSDPFRVDNDRRPIALLLNTPNLPTKRSVDALDIIGTYFLIDLDSDPLASMVGELQVSFTTDQRPMATAITGVTVAAELGANNQPAFPVAFGDSSLQGVTGSAAPGRKYAFRWNAVADLASELATATAEKRSIGVTVTAVPYGRAVGASGGAVTLNALAQGIATDFSLRIGNSPPKITEFNFGTSTDAISGTAFITFRVDDEDGDQISATVTAVEVSDPFNPLTTIIREVPLPAAPVTPTAILSRLDDLRPVSSFFWDTRALSEFESADTSVYLRVVVRDAFGATTTTVTGDPGTIRAIRLTNNTKPTVTVFTPVRTLDVSNITFTARLADVDVEAVTVTAEYKTLTMAAFAPVTGTITATPTGTPIGGGVGGLSADASGVDYVIRWQAAPDLGASIGLLNATTTAVRLTVFDKAGATGANADTTGSFVVGNTPPKAFSIVLPSVVNDAVAGPIPVRFMIEDKDGDVCSVSLSANLENVTFGAIVSGSLAGLVTPPQGGSQEHSFTWESRRTAALATTDTALVLTITPRDPFVVGTAGSTGAGFPNLNLNNNGDPRVELIDASAVLDEYFEIAFDVRVSDAEGDSAVVIVQVTATGQPFPEVPVNVADALALATAPVSVREGLAIPEEHLEIFSGVIPAEPASAIGQPQLLLPELSGRAEAALIDGSKLEVYSAADTMVTTAGGALVSPVGVCFLTSATALVAEAGGAVKKVDLATMTVIETVRSGLGTLTSIAKHPTLDKAIVTDTGLARLILLDLVGGVGGDQVFAPSLVPGVSGVAFAGPELVYVSLGAPDVGETAIGLVSLNEPNVFTPVSARRSNQRVALSSTLAIATVAGGSGLFATSDDSAVEAIVSIDPSCDRRRGIIFSPATNTTLHGLVIEEGERTAIVANSDDRIYRVQLSQDMGEPIVLVNPSTTGPHSLALSNSVLLITARGSGRLHKVTFAKKLVESYTVASSNVGQGRLELDRNLESSASIGSKVRLVAKLTGREIPASASGTAYRVALDTSRLGATAAGQSISLRVSVYDRALRSQVTTNSGKRVATLAEEQAEVSPIAALTPPGTKRQQAIVADVVNVVADEFGADGQPDVVTIDSAVPGQEVVAVGFSSSFQSTPPKRLSGATQARAIAIGDITGDGLPDFVTGGESPIFLRVNRSQAYTSLTNTNLSTASGLTAGNVVEQIELVDVSGDGRVDIVMSVATGGDAIVRVLPGAGWGGTSPPIFGSPFDISPGFGKQLRIAVGDMNGDGLADIVIPTSTEVHVFVAPGFVVTSISSFNGLGAPSALAISDDEGDGRNDVLVATNIGTMFRCRQNTSGVLNFTPELIGTAGGGIADIVAADFTGDGRVDIFGIGSGRVFFGTRRPGSTSMEFSSTLGLDPGTHDRIGVGDLNGDGRPDMSVVNRSTGNIEVLALPSRRSYRSGSFGAATGRTRGAAVASLDPSGRADALTFVVSTTNDTHSLGVFRQTSAGGLDPIVTRTADLPSSDLRQIAIGDLNQDGRADVAYAIASPIGTDRLVVLSQNANGTLAPLFVTPVAEVAGVAVGDFNHDGAQDVAVSEGISNGRILIFTQVLNSPGTFASAVLPVTFTGMNPGRIDARDMNADGLADIAVVDLSITPRALVFQQSLSGFSAPIEFQQTILTPVCALADCNEDGRVDLVVGVTASGNSRARIYLQRANGTFPAGSSPDRETPNIDPLLNANMNMVVADLDQDGLAEVLFGTVSGTVLLTPDSGLNYSLQPFSKLASPVGPNYLALGDMNGDGRLDVIVVSETGVISTMLAP